MSPNYFFILYFLNRLSVKVIVTEDGFLIDVSVFFVLKLVNASINSFHVLFLIFLGVLISLRCSN